MTWLLWARFPVLALLAGLVASFVWLHAAQEGQR